MVVDEAGIIHPDMTDPRTTSTLIHIARCPRCRETFGPFISEAADRELSMYDQETGIQP